MSSRDDPRLTASASVLIVKDVVTGSGAGWLCGKGRDPFPPKSRVRDISHVVARRRGIA